MKSIATGHNRGIAPQELSRKRGPDVLVHSDIDDSLRVPSNQDRVERSCDAMRELRPGSIVGLCTGRGPDMAHSLARSLAHFPIAYFACNNGQNLFINQKGLPAEAFVKGLRLEDQDPEWARQVSSASGPWDTMGIHQTLEDLVRERGFRPSTFTLPPPREHFTCFEKTVDGQRVHVSLPVDQTEFQVRCPDGPLTAIHQQVARELTRRAGQRLDAMGLEWQHGEQAWSDRITHYFQPKTATKRTLLEHLLKTRYPGVKYVISIGDNNNDDHLKPLVLGPQGAENFPILAGSHHDEIQTLLGHPNLLRGEPGEIAPQIEQQWHVIADRSSSAST